MTDKTLARDYAARVLAHPDQHSNEEVAAARLLQHLLPAPTLDEMTIADRAATVGMWATIDPGDDSDTWRGIIARANRSVALVCNPTDMRMGMKPTPVTASIVTPDPSVPRAWNADGTPARPESAPDSDEKPAPAPAVEVGDIIVSADDPRIEALPVGSVLEDRVYGSFHDVTKTATGEWVGLGYKPHAGMGTRWGPWTVRRIGPVADQ